MKFLLQKAGLAVICLSVAGMSTIGPAIANLVDGSEEIKPELISKEVDEFPGTMHDEVVPLDGAGTVDSGIEALPAEMPEMLEAEGDSVESETIVDIATSSDSFNTLVSVLEEAELVEVLQGEGPFTVFAPTDEAFDALPEGTLDALMAPENRDVLVSLLSYHVVAADLPSDQLETGFVESVEGTPLQVEVGAEVTVNGVTIDEEDIPASNGVIHTIDQVILPPQ